jgi:hypothetical protein
MLGGHAPIEGSRQPQKDHRAKGCLMIEVGDERLERELDARWGTRNTKLATVLLCMGFQLAKQPFSTIVDKSRPQAGYITTIWFIPHITSGEIGPVNADQVRKVFDDNDRKTFPWVMWMKDALHARDWLIVEVVNGSKARLDSETAIQSGWKGISDLPLAASLLSISKNSASPRLDAPGFMGFRQRMFYFAPASSVVRLIKTATSDKPKDLRTAIGCAHIAIRQQYILMDRITDPRRIKELMVGKEGSSSKLFMDIDGSREYQRAMLHEFHNPSPRS